MLTAHKRRKCPPLDGQLLAVFQPFIDTAASPLHSAEPLLSAAKTSRCREQALARFHGAPTDWFLSLNISPRWISRLRPAQPLPSLKQLQGSGIDPSRSVFEIA